MQKIYVSCSLEHEILRGTLQEQSKPAQESSVGRRSSCNKHGYNSNRTDIQSALHPHGNEIRGK